MFICLALICNTFNLILLQHFMHLPSTKRAETNLVETTGSLFDPSFNANSKVYHTQTKICSNDTKIQSFQKTKSSFTLNIIRAINLVHFLFHCFTPILK